MFRISRRQFVRQSAVAVAVPLAVGTGTRPVLGANERVRIAVAGINGRGEALDPAFLYLDVAGYNYGPASYEADHARHPKRVIMGTESFPRQAYPSWAPVEKHAYVIGDFVWTGMDHLGESSIGNAQLNTPVGRGGGGPGAAPGGPGAAGGPGGGAAGAGAGASAGTAQASQAAPGAPQATQAAAPGGPGGFGGGSR